MDSFFYKKYFSDWFFYYCLTIVYGFFINTITPFIMGPYSFGERIYYYFGQVLGIVVFLMIPLGIRKKNLTKEDDYKTSGLVIFIGVLLTIISIYLNIIGTNILLIFL